MTAEGSTALATLDDYERRGGFNVLHPVIQVNQGAISPVLVESVSLVRIALQGGETYNDYRYANERDEKFALSGLALQKIAAAAGVKWIPDECVVEERTRSADGHLYIRFRAGGAVRQPNGEFHVVTAHKEIDTADVADQLTDQYERKLKSGRAKFTEAEIPDMVRRDILQIREHLLSLAESKAKNRVIRQLLSLKQVYTKQELLKPFVVPRLLYRPDLTDPRAIEQVQIEGRQAADELYGPTSGRETSESVEDTAGTPDNPAQPGPAAKATAQTPDVSEGENQGEGEADSAAGPASGQQIVPPDAPPDDPTISDGPYSGMRFSEVAEAHPEYMKAVATEGRTKNVRALAQAWLDHWYPTLGGGA